MLFGSFLLHACHSCYQSLIDCSCILLLTPGQRGDRMSQSTAQQPSPTKHPQSARGPVEQQFLFEDEERQRQQKHAQFLKDLGSFTVLTPEEFEEEFGRMLRAYGYQSVQHTGQSGDKGVDLRALSPSGELVIVQCKQYGREKRIGPPE